jgi:hypothetical protein
MTATLKKELAEGRSARNSRGVRTYTRVFWVETTSDNDGPYTVGSASGLPLIGSVHPDDSGAWCTDLEVQNTNPWKGWTVTAQYSTERELSTTPTNDPAIITWSSEQFQRVAAFDKNGNAIVNSAGDPFDPPNMMDDSRRVVSVTKNLSAVPSWILTYQDAVNSDSFTVDGITIGVGLAKMQSVTVGEEQSRNGTAFRTVNFIMHLQKSGWLLEPLDAGFREIDYTSSSLINILNPGDGERPSAPVPLDGAGRALAEPSTTNCVFLSFSVYETKAFSSLPLS